ncbi:MAG: hypothetical protein ACYTF8_05280 [Planctomycetota bacterium]|jgi:hypothetical protein
MLAAWETVARSLGYVPSARDDTMTWAAARRSVGPSSTVLVGTSRIQTDVDPQVWAEELGGEPPIQLGMAGTPSLTVLENLAADSSFRGVLVLDVVPLYLFNGDACFENRSREYVQAYESTLASPARIWEARLTLMMRSRFAFQHPALSLSVLVALPWEQERPARPPYNMRPDRFTPMDFASVEHVETSLERFEALGRPASPKELNALLRRIGRAIVRIQGRGGQVVVVAMPTSGERQRIEERRHPRALYWDRLTMETSAITVHAEDKRSLSRFTCRDGSHLDVRDTRAFTLALAAIVRQELIARAAESGTVPPCEWSAPPQEPD